MTPEPTPTEEPEVSSQIEEEAEVASEPTPTEEPEVSGQIEEETEVTPEPISQL